MPLRFRSALCALLLPFAATLWGGSLPDLDDVETPIVAESPEDEAVLLQSIQPAATAASAPAESQGPSHGIRAGLAGLTGKGEFAPLALFSLGSLAVGGAFYAIDVSSRRPNVTQTAGGRSSLTHAVGFAGITALLAAGSYFYFSRNDAEPDSDWDAEVSGGIAPDGGMAMGAALTFPLSSLYP
jgi:hypothetical protein